MESEAYKKARSVFLTGLATMGARLLVTLGMYLMLGGGSFSSLLLIALGAGRTLQGLVKMEGAKKENSVIDDTPAAADEDTPDNNVTG